MGNWLQVLSLRNLKQVSGLSRLARAYSDHHVALAKAQGARKLLDQVLKC